MVNLRRTLLFVAVLACVVAPLAATARQIHRACVIPDVRGLKLGAAEKRIRVANCTVGRVTGPRAALVSAETPTAGQHKKPGAKVALRLNRGAAKRVGTHGVLPAAQPVGISGSWHLVLDSEAPRRGTAAGRPAAIADAERDEEIRQMIEARNARRRRRGEPELDLESEVARLSQPHIDDELRA